METKKGQLGGLQPLILSLVVISTFIVVLFVTLGGFQDELDDRAGSANNETLLNVTEAGKIVPNASVVGFNAFSVTNVDAYDVNQTNGTVYGIGTGNYTVAADTGRVFFASTDIADVNRFNNTDWNITSTYQFAENGFTQVNKTIDANQTIPNLLPLIILVAMIVIVLFLVMTIPTVRGSA